MKGFGLSERGTMNTMSFSAHALPLAVARLVGAIDDKRDLGAIAAALERLVADDLWLPADLRLPWPGGYRREPLFEAEDGRLSVGCFVWGPGQATPIHDHKCWGVMAVLSGCLRLESFTLDENGLLITGDTRNLTPGQSSWVDPADGDIHRVGSVGGTAISIHVYGTRFADVSRTQYDSARIREAWSASSRTSP